MQTQNQAIIVLATVYIIIVTIHTLYVASSIYVRNK